MGLRRMPTVEISLGGAFHGRNLGSGEPRRDGGGDNPHSTGCAVVSLLVSLRVGPTRVIDRRVDAEGLIGSYPCPRLP